MAGWPDLEHELDAWRGTGHEITLWWRDDDAQTLTPALERLLDLRRAACVPLALAVVPAGAEAILARRLADEREVAVLQHGYAHRNHAPVGEKKQELGPHRPAEHVARELARGRRRVQALFGPQAYPVLVPPWNRMDATLLPALPRLGFRGVSGLGPRPPPEPGLARANVHVDIVARRGVRRFVGRERALEGLLRHLAGRRQGTWARDEPTGLMTHHLEHDTACWAFVEELLGRTTAHPGVRWLAAAEVFA